jgi:DNA-binding transcriptional ArsR family regulator
MQGASTLQLNTAFTALSDPTRRAILTRLASGEATVLELGKPFNISQPAISQHLRMLERAGLIVRRVDGSRRPCRLSPPGFEAIHQWIATMRRAFEKNYGRLDQVLAEMNPQKSTRTGEETP